MYANRGIVFVQQPSAVYLSGSTLCGSAGVEGGVDFVSDLHSPTDDS